MKILYTADDQNDAQLAINAVRSVAPDAKIFWAGRLSDAGRWLSANRDVAAIVVDVEVQQQNCAPLVRHVRTLGLDAAVLIVVPEATVLPVAVLESGACQFVLKNRSRFASLAAIVGQALQRDQIGQRLQALAAEEARLREYEARLQTTLAASVRSHEAIEALEAQVSDAARANQKLERRFAAALTLVQQRDADLDATAARLRARDAELAEAIGARRAIEQRRVGLEEALDDVVRRSAEERLAAAQQATRRASEFERTLAGYVARHAALDRDLAAAREAIAHAEATRQQIEQQLREAEASRERVREASAAQAAAAAEQIARLDTELGAVREHLAQRESASRDAEERHAAGLHAAAGARAALEQRLTDLERQHASSIEAAAVRLREVEASLERSERERAAEAAAAAERATAERLAGEQHAALLEAESKAAIAHEVAARYSVEQELAAAREQHASSAETAAARLRDVEASLERAEQARAADAVAATERATAERLAAEEHAALLEAQFKAAIADEVAARRAVEQELAAARDQHRSSVEIAGALLRDIEAALERSENDRAADEIAAEERATAERLAAEQHAALLEAESDAAIAREVAARHAVEQELAAAWEQHASSIEHAAMRLRDVEMLLERSDLRRSADAVAAEARLTQLEEQHASELTAAGVVQAALEQRFTDLERQHASAMEADAARLAEQERQYETKLAEAAASRAVLDHQLHEVEAALESSRQQLAADGAAATQRLAEQQAAREAVEATLRGVETTLELTRRESEANAAAAAGRLAQRESELAALAAARLALEQRLAEVETALRVAKEQALAERESLERTLAQARAVGHEQLQNLSGVLDRTRADNAEAIERLTAEHAAALTRLEALADERDRQLKDEAARHAAAQRTAQQAHATLEGELRAALAAHTQQVDELNGELQTITRELDATRNQRDALQLEAHRGLELARQLAASRAQNRRQFEQNPVSMLRCDHDGRLREANHALVGALGYRNLEELRALDFPAAVFESGEDLLWLIQRCKSGPRQLGDCVLKKKDGGRLSMRLHAAPMSADIVEIVLEDVTTLREVEERLRQAHRMEAVGRVASEIADTCDTLLRHVSRSGHELLESLGGSAPQKIQGDLIFGDVTRAAGFLRQLSVYGQKQARAMAPVDVNKVLHDLEPVLKLVAGDNVELVLPKKASALHLDVDIDRVERVLVNVAAYGRARMPFGGRLIVELARVAVDRTFASKHPNVREGGHALIRITEVKAADRPTGLQDVPARASEPAERPGVDLGALQALIGECAGHLWMNAEPGGHLEVKIRLPLRPERNTPLARSAGKRAMARWFQS